jgi:response regulator RpfG family c-di-GMP phosphodiesterase
MVRVRDPITASHLDAVGLLARRLAEGLDLEPVTVNRITTAARLHDIGKTTIPLRILEKPDTLDERRSAGIPTTAPRSSPGSRNSRSIVRSSARITNGSMAAAIPTDCSAARSPTNRALSTSPIRSTP